MFILYHLHQWLVRRHRLAPGFVSSSLQGRSDEECGSRRTLNCVSVPYLVAICFRPSYSDLEMQTSELARASSRFSKVDQTTRPELVQFVMNGQVYNSQSWHYIFV